AIYISTRNRTHNPDIVAVPPPQIGPSKMEQIQPTDTPKVKCVVKQRADRCGCAVDIEDVLVRPHVDIASEAVCAAHACGSCLLSSPRPASAALRPAIRPEVNAQPRWCPWPCTSSPPWPLEPAA